MSADAEYGGEVRLTPIPQSTQGRSPTSVGGVVPDVENWLWEQRGCRSLEMQQKPGLSDDKKLRRWKLQGEGDEACVERTRVHFYFRSYYLMFS